MDTNWKDARVERLTERVDRIETERRDEKWRAQNRLIYGMIGLVWLLATATIAIAAFKAGAR